MYENIACSRGGVYPYRLFFFQEYCDNGGSGCWEEKVFIVMGLILIVYFLANWQAELSSPIFLSGAVNSQDG